MIERGLVVGVEFVAGALSPGSELALGHAERLAAALGLPVTLLHSTADDERWDPERDEYVPYEPLTDAEKAALDDIVARLRAASLEARLVVSEEQGVLAICHEVTASGADLVLVGKRSVDAGDGRRLGSVARSLIHDCPTAVWVARPVAGPAPQRLLAAADLSAVGERVVRCAAQVARVLEAELHVVHALSLPMDVQLRGGDARARYLEEKKQEAEQQLSAWLEGAPAVLHVGLTSPTQAVLAGVSKLEPELVVIGTVARHGLPGLVVGNTAERLLDRLEPSLLVVKPEPASAAGGARGSS
ncbi:MAG: universal stress protein [Myxococcota bacterium]